MTNDDDTLDAEGILRVLKGYRVHHVNERELQDAVAQMLTKHGIAFEQEKTLTAQERIDFLVEGGVGIEIKVKGSPAQVARQLQRYAKCEEITSLILLTSRMQAGAQLDAYLGKPVRVLNVMSWA